MRKRIFIFWTVQCICKQSIFSGICCGDIGQKKDCSLYSGELSLVGMSVNRKHLSTGRIVQDGERERERAGERASERERARGRGEGGNRAEMNKDNKRMQWWWWKVERNDGPRFRNKQTKWRQRNTHKHSSLSLHGRNHTIVTHIRRSRFNGTVLYRDSGSSSTWGV